MNHRVIATEFVRIFQDKRAKEVRRVRSQRVGRVDSRRIGRVASGNTKVFEQRATRTGNATRGSLAICCALQDLHSLHLHKRGPRDPESQEQAILWKETVKALFLAAKESNINVRLFAGQLRRHGGNTVETFDDLESFFAHPGENSWTREREAVEAATRWHDEVNPHGARLTLLVTMWPEMRSPEENRDPEKYRRFLDETGRLTTRWAGTTSFYALGCMLQHTCKNTWGEYKKYGVHNHFRDCFPSAMRYTAENATEVIACVKSLTQRMAHAS